MNLVGEELLRLRHRAPTRPATLIATRSFKYIDNSGVYWGFGAGQAYVESEVTKRFPSSFRPITAAEIIDARFERSSREAREALLRLEPPTEVRISSKVQRELQRVVADWSSGGRECAGFLFGRIEPDVFRQRTRVDILEFSAPRLADHRKTNLVRVSSEHFEDAFEGRLSRFRLVGCYHSHVGESPSPQPSQTDVDAWGARADRVSWRPGRPIGWVGLILAGDPGPNGVAQRMKPNAWFVEPIRWRSRRSADGNPVGRTSTYESEPRPIAIREVD